MKILTRLAFAVALVCCGGCASRLSGDGSFTLGRQEFASGDSIEILHVSRSLSASGMGETVVVQGRYVLQSQPSATLTMNLTTTARGGRSSVSPSQRLKVTQGAGEFELSREVTEPGDLHVSFYPTGGGSSFGGVYFEPRGQ